MWLRLSTRSFAKAGSQAGYTLIEFVVATGLGAMLTTIMLSTFIGNREMVRYDLERTSVNQNLRSVLDIVGMNIRLSGENLPPTFPALQVIDGTAGAPDELILRRNLRDDILKVCNEIDAGTLLFPNFAIAGTTPGCIRGDQMQNFNSWSSYLSSEGGIALGYIYDPTSRVGEFFSFDGIVDTGVEMYLKKTATDSWINNYVVGQSAIYQIEEWRFALNGDVLELYEDGDTANPSLVTFELDDFQVDVTLLDGTTLSAFGPANDWTQIRSVQVSLRSIASAVGREIDRSISARFFPRNILSN